MLSRYLHFIDRTFRHSHPFSVCFEKFPSGRSRHYWHKILHKDERGFHCNTMRRPSISAKHCNFRDTSCDGYFSTGACQNKSYHSRKNRLELYLMRDSECGCLQDLRYIPQSYQWTTIHNKCLTYTEITFRRSKMQLARQSSGIHSSS